MAELDLFELIDKAVKCKKFKDAFLFDEILSNVFGINKFGLNAIRLWILDHRYGGLVNFRLHQMFVWKAYMNANRIREKLGTKVGTGLSTIQKVRLAASKPASWQYIFWNMVYSYLSIFFERLLMSVYRVSLSPFADIDKGFWGGGRNLGISVGTQIGKNFNFGPNVCIVPSKRGAPIIEDDVTIWAGAVIIGNVRIGKGAVVGANSVVVRDVPPGCTVMGSPARVVFWRKTQNDN